MFNEIKLLCDVSTGIPGPVVPGDFRRRVFIAVHNLSHEIVPRNPRPYEPGHDGGGRDVVKLGDFQPPGVPVYHRQRVAKPLRGGQGPHNVEVHLGEPPGGHGDLPQLGDRVLGDLGHLARDALLAPPGDV